MNEALQFEKGNEMASFYLIRSKVLFSLDVYHKRRKKKKRTYHIGGELIDVSIDLKQIDQGLVYYNTCLSVIAQNY